MLWFRKLIRRKDELKVSGLIWDDNNKYLLLLTEQHELVNINMDWLDNAQRKFIYNIEDTTSNVSLHQATSMPPVIMVQEVSATLGLKGIPMW